MKSTWGGGDVVLPNVCICDDVDNKVHYNPYISPLTFKSISGISTISFQTASDAQSNPEVNLEVSSDGKNWAEWEYTEEEDFGITFFYNEINLNEGESIYIRGNNPYGLTTSKGSSQFIIEGNVKCSGNINSLLSNNKIEEIPVSDCFDSLFAGCSGLIDASDLALPATTLAENCYSYMFYDCTSLVNAPALPATTLAENCYSYMFYGCTSLVNAQHCQQPHWLIIAMI